MIFFGENIDDDFLEDLVLGDGDSLKLLIRYSSPALLAFVINMVKSKEDAEDILQEVYIKLWLNISKIDKSKSLESLLYTITRRLIIDFYRKASSDEAILQRIIISAASYSNTTEEEVLYRDKLQYINTFIESLPTRQRQVFQLSKLEGLNYDAISEELSISKNTISNHLVEVKRKLKAKLFCFFIFFIFFL